MWRDMIFLAWLVYDAANDNVDTLILYTHIYA